MLKLIISIIVVIALIAVLCGFELSFKPFRIACPYWRTALGIIVICIGAAIYYDAAWRRGHNAAIEKVIKLIDSYKKETV